MGIDDRDYIRERPERDPKREHLDRVSPRSIATASLLGLYLVVWALSLVPGTIETWLAHATTSRQHLFEWGHWHTLLTSSLAHANLWHLASNAIILVVVGRILEREVLGPRNLVWLYLCGALAGSLVFVATNAQASALGGSDSLLALLAVLALAAPHREFDLFGVVPRDRRYALRRRRLAFWPTGRGALALASHSRCQASGSGIQHGQLDAAETAAVWTHCSHSGTGRGPLRANRRSRA